MEGGGVDTWKERGTFFTDLDLSVGCRDGAIGSPFVLGLDQLDRADWIPPPFFPGPENEFCRDCRSTIIGSITPTSSERVVVATWRPYKLKYSCALLSLLDL